MSDADGEGIDRRSFLAGSTLGFCLGGFLGFGSGGFVTAAGYERLGSEPNIAARYHHVVDEETGHDIVRTSHHEGEISVAVNADLTSESPIFDAVSDLIAVFQNGYFGYYDYNWESVHMLDASIYACDDRRYSFSYHVSWFGASMYEIVEEKNGEIPEWEKTQQHQSTEQWNWDCETWGKSQ